MDIFILSKLMEFLRSNSFCLYLSYMYGEKNKFKNKYKKIAIIEIKKKGFKISLIDNPRLNIAIISLSLSNFIKAIIKPNIIINGKVTLIKFGIKKKDRNNTFMKSI